jgi:N-acetylglutamate synthase-like GNAT family acetyltransferase
MTPGQEITVRRVRANDAGKIAAFVNRGRRGQAMIGEQAVIQRFGNVGFLVAEQGDNLVGMVGWQAENLVVRVTDLLILPMPERAEIARALLSDMEQSAVELQCEAALLFLPRPNPPQLVQFCSKLGYEAQTVAGLPKAWREAAREVLASDDELVLVKQLREKRVLRPL